VGRIAAIADVFDALTSERTYKRAWPVEEAVEEIRRQRGQHFDPRLVDVFLGALPHLQSISEELALAHDDPQLQAA
jgi:putative two-component system response regulator